MDMSERKLEKAKRREELIKGRTVICPSCNLSSTIGLRNRNKCKVCRNILPKTI